MEKRIASMVNIPINVKSYILEKMREMKSGENVHKLQSAINGLIQFPWKPIDYQNQYSDIKTSMKKSRSYLQNVAKNLEKNIYGHDNSKKTFHRISW